jgi:hypothetical protein
MRRSGEDASGPHWHALAFSGGFHGNRLSLAKCDLTRRILLPGADHQRERKQRNGLYKIKHNMFKFL